MAATRCPSEMTDRDWRDFAYPAPPVPYGLVPVGDASIDRLLTLTDARASFTNMQAVMDLMRQSMLQQSGMPATAQAQALQERTMAIVLAPSARETASAYDARRYIHRPR